MPGIQYIGFWNFIWVKRNIKKFQKETVDQSKISNNKTLMQA